LFKLESGFVEVDLRSNSNPKVLFELESGFEIKVCKKLDCLD